MERNFPLTLVLIGFCVLVFLLEPKTDTFELDISNIFNQLFAFAPAFALEMPWTFITSIFMHASISHLLLNMFVLFIFGTYLENKVGSRKFFLIFIASGIAGNFGYMISTYALQNTFLGPYYNPLTIGIGASGAIYGILGTLALLEPYAIVYVFFVPMPMILATGVWTLTEILGFFSPAGIARGAHLGGLFLGLILGYFMRMQRKSRVVNITSF